MKKPLFSYIIELDTLTPPRALTKLARGGVAVYCVEKINTGKLRMRVKCKDLQKIFAIFPQSCYTVRVVGAAGLKKYVDAAYKRLALVLSALLFLGVCFASELFVFRIRFEGSGSHYGREALPILASAGIGIFSVYSAKKGEEAERLLMDLPSVSFCSVEKEGLVVTVTLEENAEIPVTEREKQFLSPADGVVEDLTVIRGSALVAEGEKVRKGQSLVSGAVTVGEGENAVVRQTFPVARLSLVVTIEREYVSAEESEDALERAYASALLFAEGEVLEKSAHVTVREGAFVYTVKIAYRLIASVNMG